MAQRKQRETEPESDSGDRGSTGPVALRHPLRVQILAACHQRDITPKEFAEERGIHVSNVGYHFRALQKADYIQVVREEMARGSRRHFYRAKPLVSGAILQDFIVRCVEAMEAGTFDARPDSHFTWRSLELDEQGWHELIAGLEQFFKHSYEIEAEAQERLHKSHEKSVQITLGLAGFESPAEDADGLVEA